MVKKAFNNWMMEVFPGCDLGKIIEEMFIYMKMQVEKPAWVKSRFVFGPRFDRLLFLDINFHKLNLIRGNSYLSLPDWISSMKVVINPKDEEDEECFKSAVITTLHHQRILDNPQ